MNKFPSMKRLAAYFVLGIGLAVTGLAAYTWTQSSEGDERPASLQAAALERSTQQQAAQQGAASSPKEPSSGPRRSSPASESGASGDWEVGQLRPNGLRIKPSGRSNASAVLDPEQFSRPKVKRAYALAREIPETINKLYCWCGCENRGIHRSNLACFEDQMAVNCAVCRGTAEIAYRMTQQGVTDAGKIQAAVDEEWGPEWAKQEQKNRQG